MPPRQLIFLHSFQQHVIGHSLHALIAVQYQTEASGIFSSSQKDDFSATRVYVLKIIFYTWPRHIKMAETETNKSTLASPLLIVKQ